MKKLLGLVFVFFISISAFSQQTGKYVPGDQGGGSTGSGNFTSIDKAGDCTSGYLRFTYQGYLTIALDYSNNTVSNFTVTASGSGSIMTNTITSKNATVSNGKISIIVSVLNKTTDGSQENPYFTHITESFIFNICTQELN
ncbi:hypothetical protein GQR60_19725 [Labilibaculum sp. A4]|uniref:hypothetical protein n=1 Tax=Labilibaculum TaxID=2060722 RepID=UPI000F619967|nr:MULTISPECIES: hypothetical protein [Labilibaculum]MDM8161344.1 hypothetical protein [Labilibaculum sp. K2S]MDQ1772642.1 hypothetical protein [Labilibaculum euxinus]MWN78566.1 hypothetical protein [Labilibaculum euxinus]